MEKFWQKIKSRLCNTFKNNYTEQENLKFLPAALYT